MGRPRKPIEQHVLDGTYRPSVHGPLPPDVEEWRKGEGPGPVPPEMPKGMAAAAKKHWEVVLASRPGCLRASDGPALAILCEWWALWTKVLREAKRAKGKSVIPSLTALAIITDKWDKLAGKFGMTPRDRANLAPAEPVATAPKVESRPKTKLDAEGPPA